MRWDCRQYARGKKRELSGDRSVSVLKYDGGYFLLKFKNRADMTRVILSPEAFHALLEVGMKVTTPPNPDNTEDGK